mgnify:CR=1 FL=1
MKISIRNLGHETATEALIFLEKTLKNDWHIERISGVAQIVEGA